MIIYKITNKLNGKIYIGKTKNKLNVRWSGHKTATNRNKSNTYLQNAMRNHGIENFKIEEIDKAESLLELKSKEYYWINHYNSTDTNIGYNIQYGDSKDNMIIQEQTKVKLVDSIRKNKLKGNIKYGSSDIRTIYVGVCYLKEKKLWAYNITFNGIRICKKRYETDIDAAIGRDIKLVEVFKDEQNLIPMLNFPDNLENYKIGIIIDNERTLKIPKRKSIYKGVFYDKGIDRWSSAIVYKAKRYKRGTFKTERDAAETVDWIRTQNNIEGDLNFPDIDYRNPNYIPPKTEAGIKFKYPKYIGEVKLKDGTLKYRIRCDAKNVNEYADTLEEAIKIQQQKIFQG